MQTEHPLRLGAFGAERALLGARARVSTVGVTSLGALLKPEVFGDALTPGVTLFASSMRNEFAGEDEQGGFATQKIRDFMVGKKILNLFGSYSPPLAAQLARVSKPDVPPTVLREGLAAGSLSPRLRPLPLGA